MTTLWLDLGNASVEIAGGVVLGTRAAVARAAGARRLHCAGGVVRPGAVNAHTHLYSGLAPLGMPAPAPPPARFIEILERVWWRLDRALDEASLRASAELYVAEALLCGTTALVDHHESPAFIDGSLDVLADAAQSLGCRLVTGFGATERNGGEDEGRRGLAECARFVRANRRPLVRGLVALHASFTVGDRTARRGGELCRELGVPLHVHVAEDAADVEDARRRGHAGPLERLLSLEALPAGSVLAHGVHLSEAQVARAEQLGLWLVQNPRSNAGNRVGFARALAASARVALGTDGYPADLRAERLALCEQARLAGEEVSPTVACARAEAGQALVGASFGARNGPSVAPWQAADLVVWRDAADAETPGVPPRHVVVAGQIVVEDGRLQTGDLGQIRARAAEQARALWRRMEALR